MTPEYKHYLDKAKNNGISRATFRYRVTSMSMPLKKAATMQSQRLNQNKAERDGKIIDLLAQGDTHEKIAKKLKCSPNTVADIAKQQRKITGLPAGWGFTEHREA